jgi:pimeloyl-ACP methyl ester carboxylesterase
MPEVEVSAGVIEYDDTGGSGPVVVLLHGLLMHGSLWRHVVADLRTSYRCVLPILPLGAHHRAMRAGADLSGRGLARILAEFLEQLGLQDITLVGCDWGGAQLLVAEDPPRSARILARDQARRLPRRGGAPAIFRR